MLISYVKNVYSKKFQLCGWTILFTIWFCSLSLNQTRPPGAGFNTAEDGRAKIME
jgi:hypothetical protein